MPDRSCVACRTRRPAAFFCRLRWSPAHQIVEVGPGPGRGAWVCPDAACLEKVETKPRLLGRALRHPELGPSAVRGLAGRVRAVVLANARAALIRCARAGAVVGGASAVGLALEVGGIAALVTATDASPLVVSAVAAGFAEEGLIADVGLDRAELGRLLHKGPRAVLAVRAGRPGSQLAHELRCRLTLG